MKRILIALPLLAFVFRVTAAESTADSALKKYFTHETAAMTERCLANIKSLEDWKSQRAEFRRQYQEMLGLLPMPERTELKPVTAGKLDHEEFTVEKLQFQASPGLYCTASLFLPKNSQRPAPTILYASGHFRLMTNGISYGNKAAYQADGAWFARNGYVCLVLDTVLAGEIQGIHTGTRDRGLWWWNSRGYTPAGVEAWFGIRALDYLSTRPEVDTNRFGITGHSGGGAYSWAVTALDDRIKVAAPLAGMADAHSHIVEGVMDSHCDCNFPINYHRWDFPQIAALAAPRPLLIGGTDNDRLFNQENTIRIHEKVRRIYKLHDASSKLGLIVAPGGHDETPELQLAVLRWFNRFLNGEEKPPVEMLVKKFFTPEQLRVFTELPTDTINTNIADTFVPMAKPEKRSATELAAVLREKVFGGWPADDLPLTPERALVLQYSKLNLTAWDFTSQPGVTLRLYLVSDASATNSGPVQLTILDEETVTPWFAQVRALAWPHSKAGAVASGEFSATNLPPASPNDLGKLSSEVAGGRKTLAFFAPRGVGLTAWSGDTKAQTKIRRRFMLLGQTLDGMRVWDIRRAVQMIHFVRDADVAKVELRATGQMGVNALYASLFEPSVRKLELRDVPKSHAEGPDYLGVLRVTDVPEVIGALGDKVSDSTRLPK